MFYSEAILTEEWSPPGVTVVCHDAWQSVNI